MPKSWYDLFIITQACNTVLLLLVTGYKLFSEFARPQD